MLFPAPLRNNVGASILCLRSHSWRRTGLPGYLGNPFADMPCAPLLVLLFNARQTTKDVDVFIVQPDPPRPRKAAVQVARKLDLPEGWLNDGAKGYFTAISEGEVLHESTSLLVRAVTTEQLLGMKLAAWRDAIDRGDARLLLSRLRGSREDMCGADAASAQRPEPILVDAEWAA